MLLYEDTDVIVCDSDTYIKTVPSAKLQEVFCLMVIFVSCAQYGYEIVSRMT